MSLILGILDSGGAAAGGGTAYDSIATVTVGSPVASITFSSIPATYTHLQIRCLSSTGAEINGYMQFNSDTTAANYRFHALEGNGATAYGATGNDFTISYDNTTNADTFSVQVIDILDYANTNKYKTSRTLTGFDRNGSGVVGLYSLLWMNTNAVTSIVLKPNSGNWKQDSSFALYGIKGS